MKITKRCPECGSDDIYTTETNQTAQGIDLLPRIKGGWLYGPKVEIYVGGACGHHQMFVAKEHLASIKETYKRYR